MKSKCESSKKCETENESSVFVEEVSMTKCWKAWLKASNERENRWKLKMAKASAESFSYRRLPSTGNPTKEKLATEYAKAKRTNVAKHRAAAGVSWPSLRTAQSGSLRQWLKSCTGRKCYENARCLQCLKKKRSWLMLSHRRKRPVQHRKLAVAEKCGSYLKRRNCVLSCGYGSWSWYRSYEENKLCQAAGLKTSMYSESWLTESWL